jgi:hypothetical protein
MSRHVAVARESMVPSWDAARARRVLDRAVRKRELRTRIWRAVAWSSAAATAVVLFRFAPMGIEGLHSPPTGASGVQPGKSEPAPARPPASFTDGGERQGQLSGDV